MRISDWSSDVCSSDLSLRATESVPHIVDVIGNRKSRRPLVVATGLPNAKAKSLLQAAGQDLQILAASNREELATGITRQPPDVILLDPAWKSEERRDGQAGGSKC